MMLNKFDPLNDGKSNLELLDFMGGDLAVVNAARVSYDRASERLEDKDIKLINYLIDPPEGKKHTAPLRSTVMTFKVKAPLFVCRQWWKHVIASSHVDEQNQWNEVSLRYSAIKEDHDFYFPQVLHEQKSPNKQKGGLELDPEKSSELVQWSESHISDAIQVYKHLLRKGVAREEARAVLPPCMYTSFIWTVSLEAALHFLDLRRGAGAQREIIAYANCLFTLVHRIAPYTVEAWELRKQRQGEAMKLFTWFVENGYGNSASEIINRVV